MLLHPPPLEYVHLRLQFRCEESMRLPRWKGALIRGGLGRALKRTFCDPDCTDAHGCQIGTACAYRSIFAPDDQANHNPGTQDVPRPFMIRPPLGEQTAYSEGDILPFDLMLVGRATQYIPQLTAAFSIFAATGLGLDAGRAALVSVDERRDGGPVRLWEHGRWCTTPQPRGLEACIHAATRMPSQLTLHLVTPIRIKYHGRWVEQPACHMVVQALLRRIRQLCLHHGQGVWDVPVEELLALSDQVSTRQTRVQWVDWGRTSAASGQHMQLGGIVGSVTYTRVPAPIRGILALGTLLHVGKATVFGHGLYHLTTAPTP